MQKDRLVAYIATKTSLQLNQCELFKKLIVNFYEAREKIEYLRDHYRRINQIKLSDIAKDFNTQVDKCASSQIFYELTRKKDKKDKLRSQTQVRLGQDKRNYFKNFIESYVSEKLDQESKIKFATDNIMMLQRNSRQNLKMAKMRLA